MNKLKVAELFAGVGGFRIGLEKAGFSVIWSNQWEPNSKKQYASDIYSLRFGDKGHVNENLETVSTSDIPDHDLLCGGFPCQDYSVATTLRNSKGVFGKKGVLWWQIERILIEKESMPSYLFLENVDRLVKSPVNQKGRDFALMLQSLSNLGYIVEWRVINSAEFGFPQKRKRIYILAYHKNSKIGQTIIKNNNSVEWFQNKSPFNDSFQIEYDKLFEFEINNSDLKDLSDTFNFENEFGKTTPFKEAGFYIDKKVITCKFKSAFKGKKMSLLDILQDFNEIPGEYYISENEIKNWKAKKAAKRIPKTNKNGFNYIYSEGNLSFPDDITKPSRTIITSELQKSPSRTAHVVQQNGIYRKLTPVELERLNGFPDNHTKIEGISDTKRGFLMGNALVIGVIEKIGKSILKIEQNGK